MDYVEALNIRYKQRKQYLEDPNFECLSNVLSNEDEYRKIRDNYLLARLLLGKEYEQKRNELPKCLTASCIENIFLENHKDANINWYNVYDYYQTRFESIRNENWYENEDWDVDIIIQILEKHKDKLFKNYTTF